MLQKRTFRFFFTFFSHTKQFGDHQIQYIWKRKKSFNIFKANILNLRFEYFHFFSNNLNFVFVFLYFCKLYNHSNYVFQICNNCGNTPYKWH